MAGDFFVRAEAGRVLVGGEVDTYTAADVARVLDEAVRTGAEAVEVDLTEVTFVDSSGLSALIGGAKQARAHGASFRVVGAGRNLCRVFEIAGLNEILGVDGKGG